MSLQLCKEKLHRLQKKSRKIVLFFLKEKMDFDKADPPVLKDFFGQCVNTLLSIFFTEKMLR